MESVVVFSPAGCGKTYHAEAIRETLGCKRVLDDWNGRGRLEPGTLALTRDQPPCLQQGTIAVAFDTAIALVRTRYALHPRR